MTKKITLLLFISLIYLNTNAQYNQEKENQYRLKVNAGLSLANLNMDFARVSNESIFGGSIGIEGEYILPFNKNKWSIVMGLDFHILKKSDTPQYNDRLLTINYFAMEIPFGARHYFFLNENTSLFINVFYKVNVLLNKKSVIDFQPDYGLDDLDKATGDQNLAFGLGISFKKFTIEARMDTNQNILKDYIIYSTDLNKKSLIFSYKLF